MKKTIEMRPLDTLLAPPGCVAVPCEKRDTCRGCCFSRATGKGYKCLQPPEKASCGDLNRPDGHRCIFKVETTKDAAKKKKISKRKIHPDYAPPGSVAVPGELFNSCRGCCYNSKVNGCLHPFSSGYLMCMAANRPDKVPVIFKYR